MEESTPFWSMSSYRATSRQRGRRWLRLLYTVAAIALGTTPVMVGGCTKDAIQYSGGEYGIAFELPSGWSSTTSEGSFEGEGMTSVAAWEAFDSKAGVTLTVMDSSKAKDPRGRLAMTVQGFIEKSIADGDEIVKVDVVSRLAHPVYALVRRDTADPKGIAYDFAIAGKPYDYLLQVGGLDSEKSHLKAADQLLNSVSFTGEAARWQVNPDARERYVDSEAEFSFTYPSSHLLDSRPSKNGRLVAVIDVTDPSFIMSETNHFSFALLKTERLEGRVGRARAEEMASAFVSSDYMEKLARQYWSDNLGESLSGISNPKIITDGPFPGWSYTVAQAQAGEPAREIKEYGYFTPTSVLEIYLYENGTSGVLTSVVSSLEAM